MQDDCCPELFEASFVPGMCISLRGRDLVLDKLNGEFCAINFEPFVFGEDFLGGGPAQVVQEDGHCTGLQIDGALCDGVGELGNLVDKELHEVDGPDAVVGRGVGAVFAEVGDGRGDKGRR